MEFWLSATVPTVVARVGRSVLDFLVQSDLVDLAIRKRCELAIC
jgi:hypothetical protein